MDSLKLNMAAVDQVFLSTQAQVPCQFVHNFWIGPADISIDE